MAATNRPFAVCVTALVAAASLGMHAQQVTPQRLAAAADEPQN